jgi:acyl phosphate:glycerol-3-phosphate acyltransferase
MFESGSLLPAAILVVLAYLTGSIPFGVIASRLAGGPDPRSIGSGRTGGTNTMRALGVKWAAFAGLSDVLKGLVPVLVARAITGGHQWTEVAVAFAAMLGAVRSVFIGFRGGRGVATGMGAFLAIQPWAVLIAVPVFAGTIIGSRYVSLGSLLGAAVMLPAMIAIFYLTQGGIAVPYLAFAIAGPALIWVAHADNIGRLLHGTERRLEPGFLSKKLSRRG